MTTLAVSLAARAAGDITGDRSAPECVHAVVTALGALAGVPRGAYYPVPAGRWVTAYPTWLDAIARVVAGIEATPTTHPTGPARREALRSTLAYARSMGVGALLSLSTHDPEAR